MFRLPEITANILGLIGEIGDFLVYHHRIGVVLAID